MEALPNMREPGDRLPYGDSRGGWLNVIEGGKLETVSPSGRNVIRKMLDKMAEYGDNARAVVRVTWKGGKVGHVFIAEQQKGGTVFLDPQSGRYVDIHQYIDNSVKSKTQLYRVDNKPFTSLISKCVKIKGK